MAKDLTRTLHIPEWFEESLLQRRNHFFGIGIDGYQHVTPLNNAVKDVQDVAQVLIDDYRFEEDLVQLMTDQEATRPSILSGLRDYVRRLTAKDNLIIYFSGHGIKDDLANDGFWIPVEGGKDDFSTWVANSEIIRLIQALKAHHVFLIVDACFSGSVFSPGRSDYSKYDTAPSRYALTSGALEIVPDGEPGKNSPFARRLLEGLRNQPQPYLLATELAQHVKRGRFKQKPLAHPLHIDGHMEGEFVFYRKADPLTQDELAFQQAQAADTEQAYDAYLNAVDAGELAGNFVDQAEKALKDAGDRRLWEDIQAHPTLYRLRSFMRQDTAFRDEARALYQELKDNPTSAPKPPKSKPQVQPPPKPRFDFPVPEMVYIEGGTFRMGSNNYDYENPIHEVTLDSFEIGKYPVTQRQWEAIMGDNPSHFKGEDRPVEKVSWDDCQAFVQKINEKTGLIFRLPTEAEWEYAAGGDHVDRLKWAGTDAESELGDYAWYSKNSGSETHPVGQKKPNLLGLYDMSGNVWEWCQDWYGSYPSGPQTNPTGPSDGSYRVFRGGSWDGGAGFCRVSYRYGYTPGLRSHDLGFRLAR